MECPNTVQNWRNMCSVLAVVTNTVGYRLVITALHGISWQEKDTAGMHTHTHSFTVVKKKEPGSLGWHDK
jgi:hypothetical protein